MAATDFNINPCRRSIFDVFRLDKSETGIMAIRQAVLEAKERLKYGRIVSRNGTEIEITQAQMNNLQDRLFDPIARLKEEQIVHQAHLFAQDVELVRAIEALEEKGDGLEEVISDTRLALLQMVGRMLPPLEHSRLEDDLPWPDPPAPLALAREGLDEAILRDC